MKPVDHSTTKRPGISDSHSGPVAILEAGSWAIVVIKHAASRRSRGSLVKPPARTSARRALPQCVARLRSRRARGFRASTASPRPLIRATMRRKILVVIALGIAAAVYAGYWYSAAELVQRGLLDWSAARRTEGFTIGWDPTGTRRFPLTPRVPPQK